MANIKKYTIVTTLVKQSFKGLTGSWTKYGGKRTSPVAYNQHGQATVSITWICQSCGVNQPRDLSPYLYEYPVGEYVRVCSVCLKDELKKLKQRLLDNP